MDKNKAAESDLVVAVKRYLEAHVDEDYLDMNIMARTIQSTYPEYRSRKAGAFISSVEKAYNQVTKYYGGVTPVNKDGSDSSDLEVMNECSVNNPLTKMIGDLYTKSKTAPLDPQGISIDISSDESEDTEDPTTLLTKNGNTTDKGSSETTCSSTILSIPKSIEVLIKNAKEPPNKKRKFDEKEFDHNDDRSKRHINNKMQNKIKQLVNMANNNKSIRDHQEENHDFSLPRMRKYKKNVSVLDTDINFQAIGGMEKPLKQLCEVLLHVKSPEIYFVLGLQPPRGILIHGPTGCGKTLLARAIAGQCGLKLIEITATEFISGVSGESEERIRNVFDQATKIGPCILFIDEIDAISGNRMTAQREMERRISSQLISCMDGLKDPSKNSLVLVIGATCRPEMLDPALRRVGRFDYDIAINIPSRKERKNILVVICQGLALEAKFDYDKIAELTPGYVGADLLSLVHRAASIAVKRKCSEQFRACRAERDITIVDLEDEENVESAIPHHEIEKPKTSSTESEKHSEEKKDNASSDISASKSGSTDLEEDVLMLDEKEQQEKAKKSQQEDEVTRKGAKEQTAEKGTVELKEKSPEPKIVFSTRKADTIPADEANTDTKEKSSDNNPYSEKDSEPSLLELMNWLENPPEGITFVSQYEIRFTDFSEAIKLVQPSAKREGFITVPDVTWDDVGSLKEIREELKLAVLAPVKFPEKLKRLGLTAPSGVLLCGPPGCGKTLLAKAIANEAGINFISVKGPELLNMYVGESERAVRSCFQRARNSAPCVIFFDEFDSLCPKRSDSVNGSSTRIVNQLLAEMDGVEDRRGVYILAATNRPDIIDPAILRPGRLDTILYVGLPNAQERKEILHATTKFGKSPVLNEDVDLEDIASRTEGYTGADLAGLVKQASYLALKESITDSNSKLEDLCVYKRHLELALTLLRPSVSEADRVTYEKLRKKYAAPRLPAM